MKRVSLIGDSIRMGYQKQVMEELEGQFTVWGPEDNCGPSTRILDRFDEWILQNPGDQLFYTHPFWQKV
ncbi:hypothetical protein, partial [Okeania sp. SIO1H5]|uniref:hypothetical protein n=1 Tax=Okeania sp. SIO1H5 TaxID=2607777 RepID=UPI00257B5EDE